MEELLQNIFHTIEEYRMISPGMRVIAGVSGGADSLFLLDVLRQYRREISFELLVVHVEHGLRGQESLDDAAFVQNQCAGWGIPCRVAAAKVTQRVQREGLSIEEAARAERYRIFEEIGGEWNADRIAVAHNRNDQAETVLWNLIRGSSLKGLGGILPVQGKRIRPLLFTERADIEAYLKDTGLVWRTDRTNLETEYTRNRIRLSLLPQMEKDLSPQASRHIAEAADRLRDVQEYIDRRTEEAAARCMIAGDGNTKYREEALTVHKAAAETSVIIRLEAYKKEERLIRQELLKRAAALCTGTAQASGEHGASGLKNISAAHIRMLEKLADMDCGKRCNLPGGIQAVREDGILRFVKCEKRFSGDAPEDLLGDRPNTVSSESRKKSDGNGTALTLPIPGCASPGGVWDELSVTTELLPNTPEFKKFFLKEKKYTKWISYDTIKDNLLLRTRRPGDYLVVNAQGGTKKLKDYLIDQKIPRDMRDRILLLADGPHILWVVGWRISEAVKVTDQTRQVLKITISGDTVSSNGRESSRTAERAE